MHKTEADSAPLRVDLHYDNLDFTADSKRLFGDAFVTNPQQAFHTGLKLHVTTIDRDRGDLSAQLAAAMVSLFDVAPRILVHVPYPTRRHQGDA